MDRYRVKWEDNKYYVVDKMQDEAIVSSGYYQEQAAQIVCDKKKMQDDLSGLITFKF